MKICVYCASGSGGPGDVEAASDFGRRAATRGHELVYGGGNVGLMGAVADGWMAAGGRVTGVIPRGLVAREVGHHGITSLEVVDSMHERKQRMYDLSDAFVALPGGFGTLDELFETLTWGQLGIHGKPIALLSLGGFWDPLVAFLDGVVARGFLKPEHRALFFVAHDSDDLLSRLPGFTPPVLPRWISRSET